MADGKFAAGDDAFGLEADIEQDFVLVDLDHGAGDNVTVVKVHDGAVDGLVEGHATQVIDGNGAVDDFFLHQPASRIELDFGFGRYVDGCIRHKNVTRLILGTAVPIECRADGTGFSCLRKALYVTTAPTPVPIKRSSGRSIVSG